MFSLVKRAGWMCMEKDPPMTRAPGFCIESSNLMRILLIGAAGQLAQDLLPVLEEHGHAVTPVTHEQVEICSAEAVRQQIASARPQCVINTAAFHRVDECEDQAEYFRD